MERVISKLKRAVTFYDVITILFQAVTAEKELKNLRMHQRWLAENREKSRMLTKIVQLMARGSEEDFRINLQELIKFYGRDCREIVPMMVETLYCFDNELSMLKPPRIRNRLVSHGPMNDVECQQGEHAYLYLSVENVLQERFARANGLMRGRKLAISHPAGLQGKLNYYVVIKENQLSGLKPQVWAYYPREKDQNFFQAGRLRIAMFPFSNQMWFDWPRMEGGCGFEIRYSPEQELVLKQAYSQALRLAEQRGANFVIFPEMALGATLREWLCQFLREQSFCAIKLVFAGTEWIDGENTAHIYSGKGTHLLKQKKREAFELPDKKSGQLLPEALKDHDNQLEFLDIAGFGRISYCICRDYIDVCEGSVRADLLRSGLIVASCYTPELAPFQTRAKHIAEEHAVASVVCNCCEPVNGKRPLGGSPEIGFLTVPTYRKGSPVGHEKHGYSVRDPVVCGGGPCNLCSCMDLYTLELSKEAPMEFHIDYEKIKVVD